MDVGMDFGWLLNRFLIDFGTVLGSWYKFCNKAQFHSSCPYFIFLCAGRYFVAVASMRQVNWQNCCFDICVCACTFIMNWKMVSICCVCRYCYHELKNDINMLKFNASQVMHGQDRASLLVCFRSHPPSPFSLPVTCSLLLWVYSAHVSCKATCVSIQGQQAADPLLCRYWELNWEIVWCCCWMK